MTVLVVYRGARNPDFEDHLLRRAGTVVDGVTLIGAHSGEDGLTTVRLAVGEAGRERAVAEFLRRQEDVLDAVQGSFGEQV